MGVFIFSKLRVTCVVVYRYCVVVNKLKVQWSSIRSCFARELRNEKEAAKSGSGKRRRAVYKFSRNLAFLRPHMKLKALLENYNSTLNDEVG